MFRHKRALAPKPAAPAKPNEKAREILNYRIALDTAEKQAKRLSDEIDAIDNQVDLMRRQIDDLMTRKDRLTEEHANAEGVRVLLTNLVSSEAA